MIYIVTGDGSRCGSSVMMQSLQAGGLDIVYSEASEKSADAQAIGEYHPNPGGHREVSLEDQSVIGFPALQTYDNLAIKIYPPPAGRLTNIIAGEYKIVWMHRPAAERWPSFMMAHRVNPLVMAAYHGTPEGDELESTRDAQSQEALWIMKQRRDCTVDEMSYDAVLGDPLGAFQWLAGQGWPIDPEKAATIPTNKHRRFGP